MHTNTHTHTHTQRERMIYAFITLEKYINKDEYVYYIQFFTSNPIRRRLCPFGTYMNTHTYTPTHAYD